MTVRGRKYIIGAVRKEAVALEVRLANANLIFAGDDSASFWQPGKVSNSPPLTLTLSSLSQVSTTLQTAPRPPPDPLQTPSRPPLDLLYTPSSLYTGRGLSRGPPLSLVFC
eukprot:547161-Prorocentrum_minimum.AAC.2